MDFGRVGPNLLDLELERAGVLVRRLGLCQANVWLIRMKREGADFFGDMQTSLAGVVPGM
jgi:hypothetical protein